LQKIAGQGSDLHRKYHLYVDYVGVVTMPIKFDERLTAVPMEFKKINILVPEIYDLILSKLERNCGKSGFAWRSVLRCAMLSAW
jgi:hypothetical protein